MFGLTEPQYNIVKRVARECADDIRETIIAGGKYDHVAAGLIAKHHAGVSVLITKMRFVWLIGYLEGRYGNTGERE